MDRNADDAERLPDPLDLPAETVAGGPDAGNEAHASDQAHTTNGAAESDADLDERFASIVAHWDDPTATTDPARTDTAADTAIDSTTGAHVTEPDPPTGPATATRFVALDPQAWRGHNPPEVEDHFEPPPPEPLPAPEEDPFFWAIVVGLVGGPLLVLWVVIFRQGSSTGWLYAGVVATVVGFVLLVLRKGNSRDDDDYGIRL